MEIISEIMANPTKKARLRELLMAACASKVNIRETRDHIKHIRRECVHEVRVNPKDFNAQVRKYV